MIIEVVPDVWRVPGADLKMPGGTSGELAPKLSRGYGGTPGA